MQEKKCKIKEEEANNVFISQSIRFWTPFCIFLPSFILLDLTCFMQRMRGRNIILLLVPSHLINVSIDCLFIFNKIKMGIIIVNPNSRYERLSVKWPFNCPPNLRDVGFNPHTEPRRSWVQLVTIPKNGQGWTHHNPTWSWARSHSWPNRGLGADAL